MKKHFIQRQKLKILIAAAACAALFIAQGCNANASASPQGAASPAASKAAAAETAAADAGAAKAALSSGEASVSPAAAAASALTADAAAPDAAAAQDCGDYVTVSSTGSVYAVPDMAELRFGIRSLADTASEAQKDNTKNTDSVISVLKKNGIKEESIQTTWYDVTPQYDWNTGNGDTIIGYSVSSTLSVEGVSIPDAGRLITVCMEAGASEFNGISYSCTNYDSLYGEALENAVAASKEKAQVLAKASGRSLGDVRAIIEGYQNTTYAYTAKGGMNAMDEGMRYAEESADASLMPGQAQITAAVTVTYSLDK